MLSTKTFQVLRDGPPASRRVLVVERNGVVEVADDGRSAAPGEATREIAAPDGPFQGRGWLVAQRLDRTRHRIGDEYGCRGRQSAHLRGVDDAVALQVAGLTATGVDGLVAGYDVDDHLRGGP